MKRYAFIIHYQFLFGTVLLRMICIYLIIKISPTLYWNENHEKIKRGGDVERKQKNIKKASYRHIKKMKNKSHKANIMALVPKSQYMRYPPEREILFDSKTM